MAERIVILGAGPCGAALAERILGRKGNSYEVTLFEKGPRVGGIAGSFENDGLIYDFGSHRLHRATPDEIMDDIRGYLGSDLLDRPRNGRIRLLGRYVKFPLNPIDFIGRVPRHFLLGLGVDVLTTPFRHSAAPLTFADVLLQGLGPTVCNTFYFPYAKKLWGLEASDIAAVQAHKRVGSKSIGKTMRKVLALMPIPAFKKEGGNRFFYPRNGFGQISEGYANAACKNGLDLRLRHLVREVHLGDKGLNVVAEDTTDEAEAKLVEVEADFLFSTIPLQDLVLSLRPAPPEKVLRAARQLRHRGMILGYLELNIGQFTPFDAHYYPEATVRMSRLSEPKNYADRERPAGRTGLCLEFPCDVGDSLWNADDDELLDIALSDLDLVQLPARRFVERFFTKRLSHAYPVYGLGFERKLQYLDEYVGGLEPIVTLGRQGLFAHDNTHHTIEMAYRASECLGSDLLWNAKKWNEDRLEFGEHVVED